MSKNFIKINVGGTIFSTLRSTLTKEPDSMLARMIDTKVPTETDSDGNIFIDRNGDIFKVILDFLRTGNLRIDSAGCSEEEIETEAEYFMLESLLQAIRVGRSDNGVSVQFLRAREEGFRGVPHWDVWRQRRRPAAAD